MILEAAKKAAALGMAIASFAIMDPSISHATGPGYSAVDTSSSGENDKVVRLTACGAETNCVSTNYLEPPNRYLSPLKIVKDRDVAFQRAVRDLQSSSKKGLSIVQVVPTEFYIHLTVPGTAPNSLDDIEIVFPGGGEIVNLRCEARVTLPPPPFCKRKNCINGNMDQRKRVEEISYILGLPPADQDEMKTAKWTPIFFNSDTVPGFYD